MKSILVADVRLQKINYAISNELVNQSSGNWSGWRIKIIPLRSGLAALIYTLLCQTSCGGTPSIPLGQDDNSQPTPIESDQVLIQVPRIDGAIDEDAWGEADMYQFADGSQLYLLAAGDEFFPAIRGSAPELIAGNVFLADGEQIRVLHTSAALGTAEYRQTGGSWQKESDFNWCCWSRNNSQSSLAEREDFFQREGWFGANSFLGKENELEYQIRCESRSLKMALNFLRADEPAYKQVWPTDLGDAVTWPSGDGFLKEMEFVPEDWFELDAIP